MPRGILLIRIENLRALRHKFFQRSERIITQLQRHLLHLKFQILNHLQMGHIRLLLDIEIDKRPF